MLNSIKVVADEATEALMGQTGAMTGGDVALETSISNILNGVYLAVGIVAVIVIIIGGVNYTMSQGDPSKVSKAKSTILYGVIGLIVTLMAFAITQFVINAIQGTN
ncbi:hypothetical protein IKP94_00710 [Candidatus Saccharibacteria bacterium]|nr:hypothetical protein [Candidatus Saccharibacteria bacterium]